MSKWLERALASKRSLIPVPYVSKSPKSDPVEGSHSNNGDFDNFGTGGTIENGRADDRYRSTGEVDEREREAVAIELGDVPSDYALAFAQIQAKCPAEVPRHRWEMFVNDAGLFLDAWGEEAMRLGWSVDELFGLDPVMPMGRYDRMGLLWTLKGQQVVALTATEARLSDGLAYYRKAVASP
jgi:hypothetical protein